MRTAERLLSEDRLPSRASDTLLRCLKGLKRLSDRLAVAFRTSDGLEEAFEEYERALNHFGWFYLDEVWEAACELVERDGQSG